jgi:hypothetical protein
LLEQGISTTTFNKQIARARIQRIAEWVENAGKPTAFFASSHAHGAPNWNDHVDAMWAELSCHVPTVNGYSGFVPRGWEPLYSAEETGVWLEDLERQSLLNWVIMSGLTPQEVAWIRDGRRLPIVRSKRSGPGKREQKPERSAKKLCFVDRRLRARPPWHDVMARAAGNNGVTMAGSTSRPELP